MRLGYVLKRYPRYSETFIVSEILAHEEAGVDVEIFALGPSTDTHFQDTLSRVRAPVTYLPFTPVKAADLWADMHRARERFPTTFEVLGQAGRVPVADAHRAVVLATLLADRGIPHVHAHFATSATTVARLASLVCGIPYSFTAHAKDIFHDGVDPVDLGEKLADAALVATVSDYNLAYLREGFGPRAARVQRIYNGLDLERFPYSSPRSRAPRIVAVGRLVEKKGFPILLLACARLLAKGVDFHCEIIGNGEMEAALGHQILALGLKERVRMLGARPQVEVVARVRQAAVLAAPCVVGADGNRDGLPTVLLEAMALGTPCVATPVTGIPEVVEDGRSGLLVPPADVDALADSLERLLVDEGLRERLSVDARQRVETSFDSRKNAFLLRTAIAASACLASARSHA